VNVKVTALLTVIVISSIYILTNSYNILFADSDKDFCYDQVGDGHFCFDTKEKCKHEQKHDEIAESHCYKED
jgi:hypothetical protein